MGSASLDGAGAPIEGNFNDPPSASPPISPRPPGKTDSITLLLMLSMMASLRIKTYPPRPPTARDTAPDAIAIAFTIF